MMRIGLLLVLALAACSGGPGAATAPVPPVLPSAAALGATPPRAPRGGVVYASDWFNNVVDVFDQAGSHQRPFMQFTQLNLEPAGLATGTKGNLYVAEAAGNGTYIFDLGSYLPFSYLNDAGNEPYAVAVDPSGDAYVANTFFLEDAGFVNYYPAGSTEPEYKITDPSFEYLYGMALDRRNNLYVSYVRPSRNRSGGQVYARLERAGAQPRARERLLLRAGLRPSKQFGGGELLCRRDRGLSPRLEQAVAALRTPRPAVVDRL